MPFPRAAGLSERGGTKLGLPCSCWSGAAAGGGWCWYRPGCYAALARLCRWRRGLVTARNPSIAAFPVTRVALAEITSALPSAVGPPRYKYETLPGKPKARRTRCLRAPPRPDQAEPSQDRGPLLRPSGTPAKCRVGNPERTRVWRAGLPRAAPSPCVVRGRQPGVPGRAECGTPAGAFMRARMCACASAMRLSGGAPGDRGARRAVLGRRPASRLFLLLVDHLPVVCSRWQRRRQEGGRRQGRREGRQGRRRQGRRQEGRQEVRCGSR